MNRATAFAGSRQGARALNWLGVTNGAVVTPSPVDFTIDGIDYWNTLLEPIPSDHVNAGVHTLLRMRGELYVWTPADGLSGLPNVANLPVKAAILVCQRDRNGGINPAFVQHFIPTQSLGVQDSTKIIWQRTYGAFDTDDGSGNGLAGLHNPPEPEIDIKVKRRLDLSQWGLGFQLSAPTGQLAGCRYSLTLRALWAASGGLH